MDTKRQLYALQLNWNPFGEIASCVTTKREKFELTTQRRKHHVSKVLPLEIALI
jgi:hypothetical protein